MRRRHRRVLFNVFAFSLLAIAVCLIKYGVNDDDSSSYSNNSGRIKTAAKQMGKTTSISKISLK